MRVLMARRETILREKDWRNFEAPDAKTIRAALEKKHRAARIEKQYDAAYAARNALHSKIHRELEAHNQRVRTQLARKFDDAELDLATATTTPEVYNIFSALGF